ncbi:MAG: substrate-binding domain-containing protein [Actinomycetota bacterium]|nr:substrate-binding domain-containing protein [Actinomycetota bacterium]
MNTHRVGAALLATAMALAACGGDDESGDSSGESSAEASSDTTASTSADTTAGDDDESAPPEGEVSLDDLVGEAEGENTLVVYGNPSDRIWEPVLAAFAEAHPSIDVETFDLGGLEAFQRYLSETSSGVATADVIIASEAVGWLDLVERGEVLAYEDPQLAELPDFALQAPGVYSMAVDPLVAMYNQFVIPPESQPTSLAELAEMAPDLDGSVGTVEIENSQAYTGNYGFLEANGEDGWATLEALGPHTRAESGTGALLDKATNGEYPASFFVSGAVRLLLDTAEQGEVLDYQYLTDATPLVPRGMGITAQADSPASAKLLVNWLLGPDGQDAICLGGLTPYRDDVPCEYGYSAIADVVGEDNMIVVGYDPAAEAERDAIQSRWNEAFGR